MNQELASYSQAKGHSGTISPDTLKALIDSAILTFTRNAMGRELMHTYPVYTESLLYADDILARHGCKWSLIGEFH